MNHTKSSKTSNNEECLLPKSYSCTRDSHGRYRYAIHCTGILCDNWCVYPHYDCKTLMKLNLSLCS